MLKILVVDDHEVAREGLKRLLEGTGIEIAAMCDNSADALAHLTDSFDVIVLDVRMPKMDGLALLAAIREEHPHQPVVMLSAFDNPTYVAKAVATAANDYILKSDSRATIVAAIKAAAAGQSPLREGLLHQVKHTMHSEQIPESLPLELPLTEREAQVLRHVGLGLSNKEIARSLEISIETVKEHVQNILRKIAANDRTDAAVRAVRLGLV